MLSIQSDSPGNAAKRQAIRLKEDSFAAVDKYQDLVYRTALTVTGNQWDAEDIMQEVFLKYFQSHPVFQNEVHERSWLMKVTINAGKNLIRSGWYKKRTEIDWGRLTAKEEITGAERSADVLQAVLSLPERYRIAVYLYYYEELSIREIADVTGSTEAAVSQQLSRARNKLRKKLGGADI